MFCRVNPNASMFKAQLEQLPSTQGRHNCGEETDEGQSAVEPELLQKRPPAAPAGVCKTSGSRPNGTTYTYSVKKLFIFLVFVSQIFLCKKYIEKNASMYILYATLNYI